MLCPWKEIDREQRRLSFSHHHLYLAKASRRADVTEKLPMYFIYLRSLLVEKVNQRRETVHKTIRRIGWLQKKQSILNSDVPNLEGNENWLEESVSSLQGILPCKNVVFD